MKLNKEQLQQINAFINKRGFTYYDLKLEILDHMACKVEELMTADDKISLDHAISMAHGEFGVHGFSVFEDAMKSSLQKRYYKLFFTTFLSYLKPVYLPIYAGTIYLMHWLAVRFNSAELVLDIAWGMVFVLFLAYLLTNYLRERRFKGMLTNQMGGFAAVMINIPLQLFIYLPGKDSDLSQGTAGILMGAFLVFSIITYLCLQHMKNTVLDACRKLEEQYRLTVGS
ncbi:hypothetical protein [Mucilaginibacter myungsuensis]|uniref:Uncharacterized protein n=1 Tax=Mucilaginibacter myungsuensis TaxID=649104 RepID=A0A929PWQ2_9SPHI|nr:hypothetical protein [Mucilaginibacter myungsuensis]MBE9662374.1 hypothetical protein [Mucilaginibacter myungsuensis]MDN3599189.1 hypothetical protein [Mucilaginibacter myungsuensis]